jgi:hypothetical protein
MWAKQLGSEKPIAFAVWGEGVYTAFPECASHVLLVRNLVRGNMASGVEVKLLSIQDIAALPGFVWRDGPIGSTLLVLTIVPPPREILAIFDGTFSGFAAVATPITVDHVLDASLMARVRQPDNKGTEA